MTEREALMKKLQAYAFAAYEWNLYLDTHPYDKDAIAAFHRMADQADVYRKEYEEKYAPIRAVDSKDMNYWNWIDEPWPWDKF